MSVRIGIYDFFGNAIPGIFYIFIIIYGLVTFNCINVDLNTINNLSLFSIILLITAGYILSQLIDVIASNWVKIFIGSSRNSLHRAYESFHNDHPWLKLNFKEEEWPLLHAAIKRKSIEGLEATEMNNVISIMLRNISFGLILVCIIFIMRFVFIDKNLWNIVYAVIALLLSGLAIRLCRVRRFYFYYLMLDNFVALYLFKDESVGDKKYVTFIRRHAKNNTIK